MSFVKRVKDSDPVIDSEEAKKLPKVDTKSERAIKTIVNVYSDLSTINVRSLGMKWEVHRRLCRELEQALKDLGAIPE